MLLAQDVGMHVEEMCADGHYELARQLVVDSAVSRTQRRNLLRLIHDSEWRQKNPFWRYTTARSGESATIDGCRRFVRQGDETDDN